MVRRDREVAVTGLGFAQPRGRRRGLWIREQVAAKPAHAIALERQFRGRLKEKARAAGETWAMSNLASLFD